MGTYSDFRTDNAPGGENGLDIRPSECSRNPEGMKRERDGSESGGSPGEPMASASDSGNVPLEAFPADGLTNRKDPRHSSFGDSAPGGTSKDPEPLEGSHFSLTTASATSELPIPQKDNAFSPKYILQLPQEETPAELSITTSKEQENKPLRSSRKPNDTESLAQPVCLPQTECSVVGIGLQLSGVTSTMTLASSLSPRRAHPGSILPEVASSCESPRHTQPRDGMKGTRMGADTGDTAVSKGQASEETRRAMSCSKQAPEKVSFASVYASSFLIATDIKDEGQLFSHLHSGSTALLVTSTSGRGASSLDTSEQLLQGWELCEASLNGPEHPPKGLEGPPGSLKNASICHSFESFYCHAVPTQHRDSPAWSQISLTSHSGYPQSCGARGSFPSLNAEPRLTWCCLSRSLPLPAEQKEKAHSVYSSLHVCDNNPREEGASSRRDFSFLDMKNTSQAVTYGLTSGSLKTLISSVSWGEQKPKLSRAIGAGRVSGEKVSEPEKKKGVPCRKGKAATNPAGVSNKQKRQLNIKRYKRGHLQGCVHLKASRLRKQRWALRKHHCPPMCGGHEQYKACQPSSPEQAGPSQQGKSSGIISEPSLCCEDGPKNEDNSKSNSGNIFPSISARSFEETDKPHVEDFPLSASECGEPTLQNTTTTSGLPLETHGLATAKAKLFPYDSALSPGMLLTPSQDTLKNVSIDSTSKSYLDPLGPSCLDAKDTFHPPEASPSGSAVTVSLGAKSTQKTLKIHSDEAQASGSATVEPLSQHIPSREPIVVGRPCSPLPEKSSGSRISHLASLDVAGKTQLETPALGPSTGNLHQVTVRPRTYFSTSSYYSCGEKHESCIEGGDSEKNQITRMITSMESIVAASPAVSSDISGASSKSLKRRSLEGMRKQTRVEYSDTSSDDEDRLVIEL